MSTPSTARRDDSEIAGVLDRNIHAIIQNRKEEEKNISWQDRTALMITGFIGSIRFIFIHLFVFASWIFVNSGLIPSIRFDPSFSILAIIISMEAIFLSTFVLINQNRMVKINARQADLSLQVGRARDHASGPVGDSDCRQDAARESQKSRTQRASKRGQAGANSRGNGKT